MKKTVQLLLVAFGLFESQSTFGQSSYASANYAIAGDTLYLTSAQLVASNFDTTGTNISWDYSSLTGNGQRRLLFRTPANSGVAWTYVLNPLNSNLSSTDELTYSTANVQYTDPNDFFYKNAAQLKQIASTSKIVVGGVPITLKNQFDTPDIRYVFPLDFGDKDSSTSSYTSSFSSLYYRNSVLKRVNEIVGWGSLQTPYGTFANCLKLETLLTQTDSIAIDTLTPPVVTTYYREFRWFDPSKKLELLYVKQILVAGTYVTETIEYLDNKQYFQPNALFAYYPVAPIINDTVTFQNLSMNAVSYSWDFNDPSSGASNTSTLVNPIHIFANPGVYNVRLIAYNGPLSDTLSIPVSVATVPTASFSYLPATVYEGDTVNFSNTSVNGSYYNWSFGDPTSGLNDTSLLANPYHVYLTAGTYQVMMIANSIAGADTVYVSIVVNPAIITLPTANFTYNPTTINEGMTVTFTNSSADATTYDWDFGDPASGASNSSTATDPTHLYTTAGTYIVRLIAMNANGNDTVFQTLTVDPVVLILPTANFTYNPSTITEGMTVTFTNSSADATTYDWDFGDPASGASNSSTATDPTHLYSTAGTYIVRLIAMNANGNDTIFQTLTVDPVVLILPTANFTYNPTTITEGMTVTFTNSSADATTYDWDFGDPASGASNTSTSTDPTHLYSTAGTYIVRLIAMNANGNDTVFQTLTVDPVVLIMPTANFTYNPTTITEGMTVTFTNSSTDATTYDWDFGDPASGASNSSTATDPTHLYATAGTYIVRLIAINANGNDTIFQTLTVDPVVLIMPTANFTYNPTTITEGMTVTFTNSSADATTYDWDFGDPASGASNNSTSTDPTHLYSTAGTYIVRLIAMNANGNDTIFQTLTVDPLVLIMPTANFTYNPTTITEGMTVTFTNSSTDATTYDWDFGDPASGASNTSTSTDPTHLYSTAGTYIVRLIAMNANGNDTVFQTLTVDSLSGIIQNQLVAFALYPNPTAENLEINFVQNWSGLLSLYDASGRKIFTQLIDNQDKIVLNCSVLANGLYQLALTNQQGTQQKSIVINR